MSRVSGEVVYLFAFDVANEIEIAKARTVLNATPSPFTIRSDRSPSKNLPFHRPLLVEISSSPPRVSGFTQPPGPTGAAAVPMKTEVRIWQVGVVSIMVRLPFEDLTLDELGRANDPTFETGKGLNAYAKEVCGDVQRSLGDLLIKPAPPHAPEAYTVFCITKLPEGVNAAFWRDAHGESIAALLSKTSDPKLLAPEQVVSALKVQIAFEKTDLVVMDWDCALVVDQKGYIEDVLNVLELANLQVEEFRVMDAQLDLHLEEAYELDKRRGLGRLRRSRKILRILRTIRVDFAKLSDQVDHIGKFIGDWYLARVYVGARERFHLEQWRRSVYDRLEHLDRLHSVVKSDIYEKRMLWMEATIVVLFLIDIVALLSKTLK